MTAAFGDPLAALTTVFTPPCPTSWLLTTTKTPSQYPAFPLTGPAVCDPPAWAINVDGGGFQYYSPAICPSGFAVGPSCAITKTRTAEGFPAVRAGETAVYCVPSGHTCTTDTTDFRGGVWGFSRAGLVASGAPVVVGPALQIRFRDADLAQLETHPLTPGLLLAGATTLRGGPGAVLVSPPTLAVPTALPTITTLRPLSKTPDATDATDAADATAPVPLATADSRPPGSNSSVAGIGTGSETATATRTLVPVIVLGSLLFAVLLGILAFLFLRRYRRQHAGRLRPVGVGVWLGKRRGSAAVPGGGTKAPPWSPSTVHSAPSVAELEGDAPQRWSWFSRRLPFRTLQVVRAVSVPDSRPSTVSSHWTRFDAEKASTAAVPQAEMPRWPGGGLFLPAAGRRSLAGSDDEASDCLSAGTFGHRLAGPRLSTFTRVSDGTFGRLGTPLGRESRGSSPRLAPIP